MIAVETPEEHLTYSKLDELICQKAHLLRHHGINAHAHVAFLAPTTLNTLITLFALFRLEAVACPLSTRTPPAQIPALLKATDAAFYLSETSCEKLHSNRYPHSLATMIMTSGTTGAPKVACHSLANHLHSAHAAIPRLNCTPSSRLLLSLPLYHISGIALVFRCFLSKATLVIPTPAPLGLQLQRISHASLVPTQLYRLLQEPIPEIPQCLLIGGAPLSPSLERQARNASLPIFTTYGLTEMSSMVTLLGTPLYPNTISTAPDGELLVSGPTLFQGYWDLSDHSPHRTDPHPTSDIGTWDDTGKLVRIVRKDRLFISGGENIHPEEIEAALNQLPGIIASHVIPLPDPEFGMRPCAYLLEESPRYTLPLLKEELKEFLPSFKHPVEIRPWNNLSLKSML